MMDLCQGASHRGRLCNAQMPSVYLMTASEWKEGMIASIEFKNALTVRQRQRPHGRNALPEDGSDNGVLALDGRSIAVPVSAKNICTRGRRYQSDLIDRARFWRARRQHLTQFPLVQNLFWDAQQDDVLLWT